MIEVFPDDFESKVRVLFFTAQVVRLYDDLPVLWKLNNDYLDALCFYMHILSYERLFNEKFLEGGIDITTKDSFCIGLYNNYPLIRA